MPPYFILGCSNQMMMLKITTAAATGAPEVALSEMADEILISSTDVFTRETIGMQLVLEMAAGCCI